MRQKLLQDRYFLPGETKERQVYERVAKFVAGNDVSYGQLLTKAMCEYFWLPNTPTLANAGRSDASGLSAADVA